MGHFEACDCPDLPLGGAAQAAALVDSARVDGPPVYWLDAGDRLFRFDMAMTGTDEAQRRARAVLLIDAGSVGGLDALGVGRLDLGAGLDYLQRLRQRAGFPFLSANLTDDEGTLVFTPSVLLQREGRSLGVTAVLPGDVSGQGYSSTDPYKSARREVAALKARGAELVVVLSNLGIEADAKLARVSKADLVLSSHSRELTPQGRQLGKSVAGEPASRGRYLGDVRWYAEAAKKGGALVVTTRPVLREGPQHPKVRALVESTLERLADPVLGVPPIRFESFDDEAFRGRPQ
jgi:2',3'-cyclic-nucleotide 2'-phosphodiesterase (5'-nucleotidase family)